MIIGLPWLFGFIIPFTNKEDQMLYVFLVLMLLQGPVIFVSFVCNKRAINLWRVKLCGKNADGGQKDTNVHGSSNDSKHKAITIDTSV